MAEDSQFLLFDYSSSSTQRKRKAAAASAASEGQQSLFSTPTPDIDISLFSGKEAVASITCGPDESEWIHSWLKKQVGWVRPVNNKRVIFPASALANLAWVRPPATITLDANAFAVAAAQHAEALGLKPLSVKKYRNRPWISSPRGWPAGLRVVDVSWAVLDAVLALNLPLDVEDGALDLVSDRLDSDHGAIAVARRSGKSISITGPRSKLIERLGIPALRYVGEPEDGKYQVPLMLAPELVNIKGVECDEEVLRVAKKVSGDAKPLTTDDKFPWTLWDFQAVDAGRGRRILETSGGVMFAGSMGSGKAVDVDTVVHTNRGRVRAGDVTVKDKLLGTDGCFYPVLGVYEQGVKPVCSVLVSGNDSVVCDWDHLWGVFVHGRYRVIHAAELRSLVDSGARVELPEFSGCRPVNEWVLDPQRCVELVSAGQAPLVPDSWCWSFADRLWFLTQVHGTKVSREGFEFISLVAGQHGCCAEMSGGLVWVDFSGTRRRVLSVSPSGSAEVVCFSVGSPDRLFMVGNYVPTHNTTVSLAVAHEMDLFPLLVVAPLAAFATWQKQLGEMGRSSFLTMGPADKLWDDLVENDYDAYVVSYDRMEAFAEVLRTKNCRGMIADEVQMIRNAGSGRSRSVRAFASAVPYRMGLSGTPLVNGPQDLLPQGAFLQPGEWPARASVKDLTDIYPGDDPEKSITDHLGSMMVRRKMTTEDLGRELPKRRDLRIYVQITADQRKALEDLEEEARRAKEAGEFDGPDGKFNALVKMGRMRKILACPNAAGVPGINPKVSAALKAAKGYVFDQGRAGVIFANDMPSFQEMVEALEGAGISTGQINGSVAPEDRIQVEKDLQDGKIDVVVCSLAGATAWSASPRGTWVMTLSAPWTDSDAEQANSRVYRLSSDINGPTIDVSYLHAKDGSDPTFDDRLWEILENKRRLFKSIVDREEHEDGYDDSLSMSDLMFALTGEKDDESAIIEASGEDARKERERRKQHAKDSLYRAKNDRRAAGRGEGV